MDNLLFEEISIGVLCLWIKILFERGENWVFLEDGVYEINVI